MAGARRGRVATALAAAAALLCLFGSGGCEAVVSSDVPAFACSGTALAACPAGQYCKGAGCTPCEAPGRDICDGYDNDCNGKVDDGPLSDRDGDGYSICGTIDPTSGRASMIDCDDNDKTIHPGAKELCNGKDDDCDGIVDNADKVCPSGEICVAKLQKCIASASACSVTPCTGNKLCDQETQLCVDPPTIDVGGPCTSNAACRSHICGDATILTADYVNKNGSTCTTPCCTSADCPAAFVCFSAGTGGNYCVPKSAQGLNRTGGALGTGVGGDACVNGGGDCRSGLCGANKKCLDSCCKDADCTNGTSCTFTNATGHNAYQCTDSPGTRPQNSSCGSDSDCKGGICFEYGSGISEKHCVSFCCGSSSCGTVNLGFWYGYDHTAVCFDVTQQNDPRVGADSVPLCVGTTSVGGGVLGDACTTGSDCRSTRCHPTAKKCTDVCCKDSDCHTPKTDGWTCRPTVTGNYNWLRCSP